MPEHRTDTAATPAPDDTLREMARTITAHVRLGGTTRCSCGEIWQPLHVAEAIREHVAAAVHAEREAAIERVLARCETAGTTQPPFGQPVKTLTVTEIRAALDGPEGTDG